MSKKYDAILGFIIGDALGLPYEFRTEKDFMCTGMDGYKAHYQPPGTWSDDTSMLLATLNAKNLSQILDNYCDWYYHGAYTPFGVCFDIGNTMQEVLEDYNNNIPWQKDGFYDNGNAPLCRVIPFVFSKHSKHKLVEAVKLTHTHPISIKACIDYYCILENALLHKDLLDGVSRPRPTKLTPNEGYIEDTLNNALYCIYHSSTFSEAVLMAVNAGGDTDSTAAITGSIAAVLYGIDSIPRTWIKQLQSKELLYTMMTTNIFLSEELKDE